MRWFGKAPVVHVYRRETLFRELREIGFVDVTERDVGAEKLVPDHKNNSPVWSGASTL